MTKKMKYFEYDMTPDQAQQHFRRLSQVLHPDHSTYPGAADLFIELKEEYETFLKISPYLDDIREYFKAQPQVLYRDVPIPVPPQVDIGQIVDKTATIAAQFSTILKESNKILRQIRRKK